MEGRSCPCATDQQTLSGKSKLTHLSGCDLFGYLLLYLCPFTAGFKKRLPITHSVLFFKVVIEGLVDGKSWGDIAVDDIKVLNGLSMADCRGEAFNVHKYNPCIKFMI